MDGRIVLLEDGVSRSVPVQVGMTVLDVLRGQGLAPQVRCGGQGRCGQCRLLMEGPAGTRYALACQTEAEDGMRVHLGHPAAIGMEETGCDEARFERLLDRYGLDGTAADGRGGYGLAFDIGTTTLACRLHDLASGACLAQDSCMNPQVRWGDEVASRIDAAREGGLAEMREALVRTCARLAEGMLARISRGYGDIRASVVVGNTVMQHIAAGISPVSLGQAPFEPVSLFGDSHGFLSGLAPAWFAPVLAGNVGGDIAAGVLAVQLGADGSPDLFIDVGTNGEIVIADAGRALCCSVAAGPAFEGVGIACGMPAFPGAVSRVRVEDERLVSKTIGGVPPSGVCGTGLIDLLALMHGQGIIDDGGLMGSPVQMPAAWQGRMEERSGVRAFVFDRGHDLYITQKDVRALQLSKAAIRAGVGVAMEAFGVSADDIGRVCLAGGFGTGLLPSSVIGIGMLPQCLEKKIVCVGNTAIEGASVALLSCGARDGMLASARRMETVELATHPMFPPLFLESLGF